MSKPRSVKGRIAWMLTHKPSGVGMCMQHCWHALGGNQSPPSPPRWGVASANAAYDKVIASGRYWRGTPPKGALVLWRYGKFGHAAIMYGANKIVTTDPEGKPGGVGIEAIDYPMKWGAKRTARIWTDQYAGTRFTVGEADMDNYTYKYLGKPTGTQTVGRKYVTLQKSKYDPPHAGWESTLVYLNLNSVKFKAGKSAGAVRVRIVRANGDKTAYHDNVVHVGALDDGGTLLTYTYWEAGDGQPTHVELKCIGGLESVVLGTRYTKKCVVRK